MKGRTTTIVSARVPDWVAAYLARQASSEGETVSEVIGRMLQQVIPDAEKRVERDEKEG
jgi:hypothetical protein